MPERRSNELRLPALTARELMTSDPVSLAQDGTLQEAEALFADREISAAPVIDAAGRPIGVLSRADIIRYFRTAGDFLPGASGYGEAAAAGAVGEFIAREVELAQRTRVGQVMTPTVLSVRPETPAADVVAQMTALKVHRLFVIDAQGVLVGVISVLDVLSKLRVA